MPRLTIDNKAVEVPTGTTLLDAAREVGIDIPTLCHYPGQAPRPSCLVCIVKIGANGKLVPSCNTKAEEGMIVASETPEVHSARLAALELLLSDHAGDCTAPCQRVCPAHMDIPQMIRQIAAGQMGETIATIKAQIALPAVLGRICPAPCEKACRRGAADGALSVCLLKRRGADTDLASEHPYKPPRQPASGRRVAIVGSGPAGLSGAYYLALLGHEVTVFDEHEEPGGNLRYAVPIEDLPREVLNSEIAEVRRAGVAFELKVRIGRDLALSDVRRRFDAVLLTTGELAKGAADPIGLVKGRGLPVDATFAMPEAGLFAAGAAVRPSKMAIRSAAEGKSAAESIDQFLRSGGITQPRKPFQVTLGQVQPDELAAMMAGASAAQREHSAASKTRGLTVEEAIREAQRCLHCDCRKADDCKLRIYADQYGADLHRYDVPRPTVRIERQHGGVIYEPGKCIDCGLCVRIAAEHAEPLGLTFIGRGFNMRPGVPFGASFDQALMKAAQACIKACPTGALAFDDSQHTRTPAAVTGVSEHPGNQ